MMYSQVLSDHEKIDKFAAAHPDRAQSFAKRLAACCCYCWKKCASSSAAPRPSWEGKEGGRQAEGGEEGGREGWGEVAGCGERNEAPAQHLARRAHISWRSTKKLGPIPLTLNAILLGFGEEQKS